MQVPCAASPKHAYHQGYSDSLGTEGAQTVVVEIHVRLFYVPEEVRDRHHIHYFAGLQVQLLLSSGEGLLSIYGERQGEVSFALSSL